MRDVPLGTLIFRAGLLAEEQLEDALQEGMRKGKRLGEVLLERGWLHERDLGRLLAGQKGLPFVEVRGSDAEAEALERLPEEKARMQNALPLRFEEGHLVVAVADPSNELVIENLRRTLGLEPRLVVAPQADLIRAIADAYAGGGASLETAPQEPAVAQEPVPLPEPTLAPEPTLESEPALEPEPTFQSEEPDAAHVVTALPTVVPPAEAWDAESEAPLLQPIVNAPAVEAVEQPLEPPVVEPFVEAVQPPLEQPVIEPPVEVLEPPLEQPAIEPLAVEPPPPLALEEMPTPSLEEPAPQKETTVPESITPANSLPVEAQPAPLEPLTPVSPLLPVEATEPQPVPEAPPEPPVVPPAAEHHVETAAPLLVGGIAPEPGPAPLDPPAAIEQLDPGPAHLFVVLLRLRDGEVFDVGTFESAAEASARAQEVLHQISAAEGAASWPFFNDRYLRPDTIVSIDLLEEPADKWMGSAIRTRWAENA